LKTTVELIQTHSRQFAKRQLTWFRHLPRCKPISVSGEEMPDVPGFLMTETNQ
jgi:tRNA dimethylallyltransferase